MFICHYQYSSIFSHSGIEITAIVIQPILCMRKLMLLITRYVFVPMYKD